MPHAVGLCFDAHTEETIVNVWHELESLGVGTLLQLEGFVPHLTMVLSEHVDVAALSAELEQGVGAMDRGSVQLSSVSLFTNPALVLHYSVTPTDSLLQFHKTTLDIYQKHSPDDLGPFYLPGTWIPHCALAIGLADAQIEPGINAARRLDLPLVIESLDCVVVEHDQSHAEIIHRFPWRG